MLVASQRGFRFKEEINFHPARDRSKLLMRVTADHVIDFSATYNVFGTNRNRIGTLTRKGFKSMFVADEWSVRDKEGRTGLIAEHSRLPALLRRFVPRAAMFLPQTYHLTVGAESVATLRQHTDPLALKMSVRIEKPGTAKDRRGLVLASAVLLMAIDGRQDEA